MILSRFTVAVSQVGIEVLLGRSSQFDTRLNQFDTYLGKRVKKISNIRRSIEVGKFLIIPHISFSLTSEAAITHVANDNRSANNSSAGTSVTVSAVGANNLMVVLVSWCCVASVNTSIPTISDNQGNTWIRVGSPKQDGINDWVAVFYAIATNAGTTSVSATAAGNQWVSVSFSEYSGVNTSDPLDGTVNAIPYGKTADSGAFSPNQSGDLIVCITLNDYDTSVPTVGSGFTLLQQYPTGTYVGLGAQYQIYNSLSPVNCTMTYTVNADMPTILAAFKPADNSTGTSGGMRYNSNSLQFHNGSSWQWASRGVAGSSCSTPGSLRWNSTALSMEFCGSSNWQSMKSKSTMAGSGSAGQVRFQNSVLQFHNGNVWTYVTNPLSISCPNGYNDGTYCYLTGEPGESCNTVCVGAGRTCNATGTQAASSSSTTCQDILTALGYTPGTPSGGHMPMVARSRQLAPYATTAAPTRPAAEATVHAAAPARVTSESTGNCLFQPIPYPRLVLNHPPTTRRHSIHLLSNLPEIDTKVMIVFNRIWPPDVLQNRAMGHHLSRVVNKDTQERILGRG